MADRSPLSEARARFAHRNRQKKARFAIEFAHAHRVRTILLVGVSSRPIAGSSENIIEDALIGTGEFDVLPTGRREIAEGWDEYQQADALNLPFQDNQFDLVYSNAVIEHVGDDDAQRRFVSEHARVGRHWILTTPNRWFPVESHTLAVFAHWSPSWDSRHANVVKRLLSPRTLRSLLPPNAVVYGHPWSATLTATSP